MSYSIRSEQLEDFLSEESEDFKLLNKIEYSKLIEEWKQNFQQIIMNRYYKSSSIRAVYKLEAKLPDDVFLFSTTNNFVYELSYVNLTGYKVYKLQKLSDIFCNLDLVITDFNYSYSCVFFHHSQEPGEYEEFFENKYPWLDFPATHNF